MDEIKINPLDVLNARRFNFLAPHLEPIVINDTSWSYSSEIPMWIEHNLKGRYFYGTVSTLVDNTITTQRVVSFEESNELTFFLLKCPYIGQN
jgi:hypothetical protein